MPGRARIDWTNDKEWARALTDAVDKIQIQSVEGAEKLGTMIVNAAKRYAPVDTGRLRSSISHRVETAGGMIYLDVTAPVHYAPHQEYGTRYMPAHPFLRPGLADGASRYLQAMSAVGT